MYLVVKCKFSLNYKLSGPSSNEYTSVLLTILSILREEQRGCMVIRRPRLRSSVFPTVLKVGGSGDVNMQAVVGWVKCGKLFTALTHVLIVVTLINTVI